jgi:hypothetical protein
MFSGATNSTKDILEAVKILKRDWLSTIPGKANSQRVVNLGFDFMLKGSALEQMLGSENHF